MIIGILTVLVITISVAAAIIIKNNNKKEAIPKASSSSSKVIKESSSSEETKDARDPEYYKALATLEKSDTKATDEETKTTMDIFTKIQKAVEKEENAGMVEGTFDNHLSMTDNPMTQSFAMALIINKYKVDVDHIEVYKSLNSDVVQFVCPLIADGKETSYWAGNLNVLAEQVQLVSYHGGEIGGTFG